MRAARPCVRWTLSSTGHRTALLLSISGIVGLLSAQALGPPWTQARALAAEASTARWAIREDPALRDARVERVRHHAREALSRALARAFHEFGPRDDRVAIRWILDFSKPLPRGEDDSSPAWGPRDLKAGATRWLRDGGLEVVVWGRRFLWNPAEIRTVVAHEAVHAHLAASLGSQDRYTSLASWFREGLAIWFSGEGPAALDAALSLAAFSEGRADRCLRGIPPPGRDSREASRADAYVAFAWLESRVGADGVRALARTVARGTSLDEAVWSLIGLSLPAFRASVFQWGRALIRTRLESPTEARFVDSIRLRQQRRTAEAAACWSELLNADPDGPLVDTLRYLLSRHRLEGEAAPLERVAVESQVCALVGSASTLWRAEGLVLLAELRAAQGRSSEAAEAWTTVLEAYWDEPGPVRRARQALQQASVDPSAGG